MNIKSYFVISLLLFSATFSQQKKPQILQKSSLLEQISNEFANIATKATPATVFIKTERKAQGLFSQNDSFEPFRDEFLKRFFGQGQKQENKPRVSGGSGVIVKSDGTILTNHHVVKGADKITVVLKDGKEHEATLLGDDPNTDLAIVKIDQTQLPFLEFGNSNSLQIGNLVFAVGNPFALESSFTHGVVSALKRHDLGITMYDNFIQTDAAINPGNSGGPLLNVKGEIVGINTAIFSQSGGNNGIGFAIPSNIAKHVMDQILATGSVKRSYLGIMLQPIDKELAEALGLKNQEGVLVAEVAKDSPAEKSGLKQGDIIIEFEGEKIKSAAQLRTQIALEKPGSKITLTLLRENKPIKLSVVLEMNQNDSTSTEELLEKLGIQVDNLTPDLAKKLGQSTETEGVIITKILPGSPAEKAGLKPYFLITGLMKGWGVVQPVSNTKDLSEALKQKTDKQHVVFVIRHQNYQRYYTIKIP